MSIAPIRSEWSPYIHAEWVTALDRTLFLTRCRERSATREELRTFLAQQFHYSRHFTRYLCALISNIPDEADRLALTQNLFEEMGFGSFGNVPHAQLYRRMLEQQQVQLGPVLTGTQALVETMMGCSRNRSFMVGLGALCCGAEAIVPRLYSTILEGFAGVGEDEANLEFFRIHVEGDDEHAQTMRGIIERTLEASPASRVDLEYGAEKAIAARIDFLNGITPAGQTWPRQAV